MSMAGLDGALQMFAGSGTQTLSRKTAVRCATIAALPASTLAGTVLTADANGVIPAIDGVTVAVGDRVFTPAEAAARRLLWTVTQLGTADPGGTPWILTMAQDADTGAKLLEASDVWVAEGATLQDSLYELVTDAPITPGTTALTWRRTAGPGAGATGIYTVDAGVAVGDCVYLSAADTAAKANATTSATAPAFGFVESKPTTTSAVVQQDGELTGLAGLTAGATYYLATTAGAITATAPTTAGNVVQRVGVARSATVLVIECDRDMVVL